MVAENLKRRSEFANYEWRVDRNCVLIENVSRSGETSYASETTILRFLAMCSFEIEEMQRRLARFCRIRREKLHLSLYSSVKSL